VGGSRVKPPDLAFLRQAPPPHFKTDEILNEFISLNFSNHQFAAAADHCELTAN